MNLIVITTQFTILILSLLALIKGSDYFIQGSRVIGQKLGFSPFIIGVLLVGFGTSLPELASSIAAVYSGVPEVVIANVVGSNITNILLVVGVLALFSKKIVINKDLLKSELTLFVIATTHFLFILSDGVIDRIESFLLLGTFAAYIWYIIKDVDSSEIVDPAEKSTKPPSQIWKPLAILTLGLLGVIGGAHYTVGSALQLATILGLPISIISILGIAIGTSLPELIVSLQAIKTGGVDLAIGNIFGSNAINMLLVAGLPAMITNLPADEIVMGIGMHILLASSVIFLIHGLARRFMKWEGAMLLLFYGFFIVQLFSYI
jgi:cation:H+ antiporter